MSVKIWCNVHPFYHFKQFDLIRNLDTWSGDCQITVSENYQGQPKIHVNDLIQVELDGQFNLLFGYAETYDDNLDAKTHDIGYKIRDNVQDIIDSTVPENFLNVNNSNYVGSKKYTTYASLVEDVIFGITGEQIMQVIDQKELKFPAPQVVSAQYGQKAGDFLMDYGRLCHAILSTDGEGNVIILSLDQIRRYSSILNQVDGVGNNVLDAHLNIDYSGRYNTYIFRSTGGAQTGNDTWGSPGSGGISYYSGTAIDPEIRSSRTLEVLLEKLGSNEACQNRAQEEANLRRARSVKYTVTVQGFSTNGELWDIGKLVSVYDDENEIHGLMMIKEVKYHQGNDGEICTMTLCYPDAYGITATLNDQNVLTVTDNYVTSAASTAILKKPKKIKPTTLAQTSSGVKK